MVLPMPSRMRRIWFMSAWRGGRGRWFRRKIKREHAPAAIRGAFPPEQAPADRDAFFRALARHIKQRPEMEFAALLGRTFLPRDGIPQEGGARVTRSALIVSHEREKGRPRHAHALVARKKHLERAGKLPLAAARAVVPRTDKGPHVGQVRGGGLGTAGQALLLVPIEKIEELRALTRDALVVPAWRRSGQMNQCFSTPLDSE